MAQPGRKALFVFTSLLVLVLLISACAAPAENTQAPDAQATPVEAVVQEEEGAEATATTAATSGEVAPPTATAPAGVETPTEAGEIPVTQATAEGASDPAAAQVPTDSAASLPDPNGYEWVEVVTGLNRPLDIADLGDGSGRLLALEQPGVIRVIENNSLLPEPFLDITDRVGSSGNEQGLLGIALHPKIQENGFFYVNYTDQSGDTTISRFSLTADDAARADPNSEVVLLKVDQPYPNHNGGVVAFGPDGYLYLGLGDGGSAGDPQGNGQSLDTLLGKILRIDVDNGDPYTIPADNPFAGGGGLPEIFSYGWRNPWRFSFDRLTGDLYVADVGQNQWEEISFTQAGSTGGENYGWNYREGTHEYQGNPPAGAELIDPIYEYSHADGCSVTGGYVYRGQALPAFRGVYLFADFCSGKLWGLLRGPDGAVQAQELYQTGRNISSFGQDASGELYITDQANGGIYRLQEK